MEQEFEEKMEQLRETFNFEKNKKAELDKELQDVKNELENIEISFPKEVSELREQIEFAKQKTLDYEKKTKELQSELNNLKAKK